MLKSTKDPGGTPGINGASGHSGNKLVAARSPESGGLAPIEDAPGTYVKCKMDDDVPALPYTDLSTAKKPKAAKPVAAKPAKAKPTATKKSSASKQAAPAKTTPDDLTKINGVGPKLAKTLSDAGISSFEQVAAMTSAALSKMLVDS